MDDKIPQIIISHSNEIINGYFLFPFLISQLSKKTLFQLLNIYIPSLNIKYKQIIEHIEKNIKSNNISSATITIEITNPKFLQSIKKSKSTKKSQHSKKLDIPEIQHLSTGNTKLYIIEIILNAIDDRPFQKNNNFELLESLRLSGYTIFNICKTNYIENINIFDTFTNYELKNRNITLENISALLEGLLLSAYKFTKYKTNKALNSNSVRYNLNSINVLIHYNQKNNKKKKTAKLNSSDYPVEFVIRKKLEKEFERLKAIVKTVFLSRDLVNEPANNNKFNKFISSVKNFISKNKLAELIDIQIIEKEQIEKLNNTGGMGLLLGVGKGSTPENQPRLLIMKYSGNKCISKNYDPAVILLGKGVTYDTGGLNLKKYGKMVEMKSDLSGASCVVAFLCGYALLKGDKCISVICPFTENSIGPASIKPSDVLTAYNGQTVEITDTDAEGRLIMADCLAYATEKYPNALLIDFATLTGQQEQISDKLFSNILSVNATKETSKMISIGMKINEMLVELPLSQYNISNYGISKLKSYVADIRNITFSSNADIIMSAIFMKQFIKHNTKWIHIDIAGPSFKLDDVIKYASPEASGIGIRLLFEYFS